jgi:hypothetical protein
MKQFVLMVAISVTGDSYEYVPAAVVDENSCMMMAKMINNVDGILQHAYCAERTMAPLISPRPQGRP